MKQIIYLSLCIFLFSTIISQNVFSQCTASNETNFLSCLSFGSSSIHVTNSYPVSGDLDLSNIEIVITNGKELTLLDEITVNSQTTVSGGGTAKVINNGMTGCNTNCGDVSFAELNARLTSGQYPTLYEALNAQVSLLPIELDYFNTINSNGITLIEWHTSSETNNDYFEIEWSENGIDFQTVMKIYGAGTTTDAQFYSWEHKNQKNGTHYYRLKQTDFDGNFSISKTNVIEITALNNLELLSNLIERELRFSLNEIPKESLNIFIIDFSGKIYHSKNIVLTENNFELNVSDLNKGNYIVSIQLKDEVISKRFIKG